MRAAVCSFLCRMQSQLLWLLKLRTACKQCQFFSQSNRDVQDWSLHSSVHQASLVHTLMAVQTCSCVPFWWGSGLCEHLVGSHALKHMQYTDGYSN